MTTLTDAINSSNLEFTSLKTSLVNHFSQLLNPIFDSNVGFLGYTEPKETGKAWCNVALVDPSKTRYCASDVFRSIRVEIAVSSDPSLCENVYWHDALVDLVESTFTSCPVYKYTGTTQQGLFYGCALPDAKPIFLDGEHELEVHTPTGKKQQEIRTTIMVVNYTLERNCKP